VGQLTADTDTLDPAVGVITTGADGDTDNEDDDGGDEATDGFDAVIGLEPLIHDAFTPALR